ADGSHNSLAPGCGGRCPTGVRPPESTAALQSSPDRRSCAAGFPGCVVFLDTSSPRDWSLAQRTSLTPPAKLVHALHEPVTPLPSPRRSVRQIDRFATGVICRKSGWCGQEDIVEPPGARLVLVVVDGASRVRRMEAGRPATPRPTSRREGNLRPL